MIPEYIELTGCNKWTELININYILNVAVVRLFKKIYCLNYIIYWFCFKRVHITISVNISVLNCLKRKYI